MRDWLLGTIWSYLYPLSRIYSLPVTKAYGMLCCTSQTIPVPQKKMCVCSWIGKLNVNVNNKCKCFLTYRYRYSCADPMVEYALYVMAFYINKTVHLIIVFLFIIWLCFILQPNILYMGWYTHKLYNVTLLLLILQLNGCSMVVIHQWHWKHTN